MFDSATRREAMVRQQIAARGVSDPRVLEAMRQWFDETPAVHALPALAGTGVPDTYPFGL
jgi:hypothetical protein